MNKGKVFVSSGLVLVVLIIEYVIYKSHWSRNAEKGEKNILNSRKVKSQMIHADVLSIMGKPDTIINERFCYFTNDDSYPYVEFSFDSLKRVQEIFSPDE